MSGVKAWPVPELCHACGQKTVTNHCRGASPNCIWVTCDRLECKAVSGYVIDQSKRLPAGVPPLYKPVFIYGKSAA